MRREPDRTLAWETLPGTSVPNSGIIRFHPSGKGGTAVDIRLDYAPPAGALSHAFAKLVGADPKRKPDQDLLIIKEFLERSSRAR